MERSRVNIPHILHINFDFKLYVSEVYVILYNLYVWENQHLKYISNVYHTMVNDKYLLSTLLNKYFCKFFDWSLEVTMLKYKWPMRPVG